ncbi:MAG TPA: dihydroneopterin aldolase [Azospirillaceae bacterium]|nr:dihydroneopterin aldolase [Azospirillaceae bacterium]
MKELLAQRPAAAPVQTATVIAAPTMRVFVRDLNLQAVVGIYAHEKVGPQRIRVSLDLEALDRGAHRRDEIADVVSYEDAINLVRGIVAEGHVNLIETLAERIAQGLLDDRRILAATVKVEKLDVFPDAASVGIEITRRRG